MQNRAGKASVPFSALDSQLAELEVTTIVGPIRGVAYEDDPYAGRRDDFKHALFMLVNAQLGGLELLVVRATHEGEAAGVFAYSNRSVYQLDFTSSEFAASLPGEFANFNSRKDRHIVTEIHRSGSRRGPDTGAPSGPSYADDLAGWLRSKAPRDWTRDTRAEQREKARWLQDASPTPRARASFSVAGLRSTWKELVSANLVVPNKPASAADLATFEETTGFPLPRELKALAALSNGAGLPGSHYERLLGLREMATSWSSWKSIYDSWTLQELIDSRDAGGEGVVNAYVIPGWVPLADENGNMIGFDRQPAQSGKVGQIVSYGRDQETNRVIAPDLIAFLRSLAS